MYKNRLDFLQTAPSELRILYIIADELIANIDETVNPCHDFYQFACEKWNRRPQLEPDSMNHLNDFYKILKRILFL